MTEQQAFYESTGKPKREALARIREELGDEPRQPDEFTKADVGDMLGISYKAAEYRLEKLIKEKKVTSRLLKSNLRLYKWVK